jgi:hypothetical protein
MSCLDFHSRATFPAFFRGPVPFSDHCGRKKWSFFSSFHIRYRYLLIFDLFCPGFPSFCWPCYWHAGTGIDVSYFQWFFTHESSRVVFSLYFCVCLYLWVHSIIICTAAFIFDSWAFSRGLVIEASQPRFPKLASIRQDHKALLPLFWMRTSIYRYCFPNLIVIISVAEPHHFYEVPPPALAPTLL